MKQSWPAAERNKHPILEVLQRVLPQEGGTLLEIASGTGQHCTHFARALPTWRIQPTDPDPEALVSVRAWIEDSGVTNVELPVALDVMHEEWPIQYVDAIFNSNMIHIAPWAATLHLFDGAARLLQPGSPLVMYGPYKRDGKFSGPADVEFDESLKSRNPEWGLRDLEAVVDEARQRGLVVEDVVDMPANNFTVIYRRE
jgi:ubiquinone/menaquinone biosynthesis C-methylase UbiE